VKLLDKFQNTNRLYILLLFPVIGILLFAAIGIKDKVHFVGEMKQIEQLTKLTIQITALVHETQIERGKTSVYMYSQGTRFSEELLAQYLITDKLLDKVTRLLTDFNNEDSGINLHALLKGVIKKLKQISVLRRDALALNISMLIAIDYYSDLNTQFLKIISVLPSLSEDSSISRLSHSYLNLLKGKEKAGLERAIIGGILTAHRFSPHLYLQAISVSAQQQMYFDNFSLLALPDYLALFEKAESSDDSQKVAATRQYVHQQIFQSKPQDVIKNLRALSANNTLEPIDRSDELQVNISQWFTHSTNRVNSLKGVEDSIAVDLLAQAQQAKFDAFYSLVFYSVLVVMAIIMSLVIPVIFKKLQLSRRKLDKNINELNLTRDELVQSEKIGSLGRMVAGFAHEVNTPIGIAVGSVSQIQQSSACLNDLLKQDEVEEQDLLENIETISTLSLLAISNLNRAARLVQSFKRTSVDQLSEKARRYNVKEVLDDVVFTLNSKLIQKAIKVELSCSIDFNVFGQPGRFDQLITNLIINSVAHAFDDSINDALISITVARTVDNLICVSYTDNGKGMESSEVDKIFEPFFTTSRTDGTGLGMYICHSIAVNDMHGHIRCESSLGNGILFEIIFPCQEVMGMENES
jgi:signal transduction histidine kinase